MDQFKDTYAWDALNQQSYTDEYFCEPAVAPLANRKKFTLVVAGHSEANIKLAREFKRHAKKWKEETFFLSSTHDRYFHFSYQRIIGMGKEALPLIFHDLRVDDADWFWALRCITGKDPVPQDVWGDFARTKEIWLRWADKNALHENE